MQLEITRRRFTAKNLSLAIAALAVVGSVSHLGAQNPNAYPPPFPPVASCPIPGGIKSFVLEHILEPTAFISAFIPSFSSAQLADFFDPTKEVHTRFTFSTSDMIFRAYSFAVPKGAPAYTPDTGNFEAISIAKVVVAADKVYTTCSPRPTITVMGAVTGGTPVYGSMVGLTHFFGFSFDPASTTNINNAANITVVNTGTTVVQAAMGSVTVTPAVTTAAIAGSPMIQSLYRQLVLDGTSSTTDTGPLTYLWTAQGSGVAILDPTAAQTRIQVGGLQGDYPVTLTVTSARGQQSSSTTLIRFVGRYFISISAAGELSDGLPAVAAHGHRSARGIVEAVVARYLAMESSTFFCALVNQSGLKQYAVA